MSLELGVSKQYYFGGLQARLRKKQSTPSKKQIVKITSRDKELLVTMCTTVSAQGTAIPLFMIFQRMKYLSHIIEESLLGNVFFFNPSGWITGDNIFSEVLHLTLQAKC